MASADSLDDDFYVEDINDTNPVSDGEGKDDSDVKESAETKSTKTKEKKDKKKKKPKAERPHMSFESLGVEISPNPELDDPSISKLIDQLYLDAPKPLYVKSHTKLKVLIISSSALRCLEIFKQVREKAKTIKLFARHLKINDQIESLKKEPFLVGVGTPGRIRKIIEQDKDAIRVNRVEYVIVDNWVDSKNFNILDNNETREDTLHLVSLFKESALGIHML
ncbi:cms1 ribosomal small subunit [Boothiomyces macroporosus]|uniref:Cms1 ribosomal small subunit n=1 Tax=Boothiomyces macroporosus TaxID=261099 RepID=A0AAD5Y181_9FUNG|nr:cms1 ribosomal small subunit [Boothiomyces macroporosus]